MKYSAEFKISVTVEFEDDGDHTLQDQAFEAVESFIDTSKVDGIELLSSSLKEVQANPTPAPNLGG